MRDGRGKTCLEELVWKMSVSDLMDDKNINVTQTPELGNNNFWVWGIAGYSDTIVSDGLATMPLSCRYEGTGQWG